MAAVTRVQGLGERCRGLAGVLAERRRSLAQALAAAADADVVSTLEADAARLSDELVAAAAQARELDPESRAVAAAEAELTGARTAHDATVGDLGAPRAAQEAYAVARGEREPLRRALERDRGDLVQLEERVAILARRRSMLDGEAAEVAARLAEAEGEVGASATRADAARIASSSAAEAWDRADGRRREAERVRHRLEARAEALARTAAEARGAVGADVLAGVSGVIGSLVELVEIDEGWQGAFEAAVGAAFAGVVVEDTGTARAVLSRLHESDVVGTILTLRPTVRSAGVNDGRELRHDAEPVRRHVRSATAGVEDLLDGLLAGAVAVSGGWRNAVDYAIECPDLVVVTSDGDRFSTSGWVVHAGSTPDHAAATDEAGREADAAAAASERARIGSGHGPACVRRRQGGGGHQGARGGTRCRPSPGARRGAHTRGIRDRRVGRRGSRGGAPPRRSRRSSRTGRAAAGSNSTRGCPSSSGRRRMRTPDYAAVEEERQRQQDRQLQVESRRRDLEVRVASLAERRAVLTSRLQDVERRLAGHVAERDQAGERRRRLEGDARAVDRLGVVVDRHAARLAALTERLQAERSRQLDEVRAGGARLEHLRRERSATESRVAETRDLLQRLALELAESGVRQESAVEALRRELGCEPGDGHGRAVPELPEGDDAARRAAAVEAELASLGPVNPLALEELGALEERHRFLEEQVEDVRRARRELHQVIRAVDDEIMRVFAEAFADVNEHFQVLVATLFPGGTGRLVLTDPTDLLDTGVEVEARPAGKNVRKLSLLSGGERSLVALAFLFAVFRSRPSPFYLMDEVEAALDDVNLHRFLDLLHEFRGEAQLIIVSHQKRTMEAADALYGVTMTPGGSSKVVSQKVRREPDDESAAAATDVTTGPSQPRSSALRLVGCPRHDRRVDRPGRGRPGGDHGVLDCSVAPCARRDRGTAPPPSRAPTKPPGPPAPKPLRAPTTPSPATPPRASPAIATPEDEPRTPAPAAPPAPAEAPPEPAVDDVVAPADLRERMGKTRGLLSGYVRALRAGRRSTSRPGTTSRRRCCAPMSAWRRPPPCSRTFGSVCAPGTCGARRRRRRATRGPAPCRSTRPDGTGLADRRRESPACGSSSG